MFRTLMALGVALAAPVLGAEERDPMHSPECGRALAALQAAEAASAPSAPSASASARLQAPRQRAAVACLGGRRGPSPAPRSVRAPISIAPVVIAPPSVPSALPAPAAPVVPKSAAPATLVLGCDSVGCWGSDGSFLNRAGGALLGPRGLCRVEGQILVCP